MAQLVDTVWQTGVLSCRIYRVGGLLEVRLYEGETARQVSSCRDLPDCFAVGYSWQAKLSRVD